MNKRFHDASFHSDALRHLLFDAKAKEVLCVMLKDQLVSCDVRVRGLTERSSDPLMVDLQEMVRDAGPNGITVRQIASKSGYFSRFPIRVVAEVLHALERSGKVVRAELDGFRASQIEDKDDQGSIEQVVEKRIRYVPRSGQIGPEIPAMDLDKLAIQTSEQGLRFWEDSNAADLYNDDNLVSSIKRAYIDRRYDILPESTNNNVREEILQRSLLLSTGFRVIGCSVIGLSVLPLWVLHKCYLFRSLLPGREGWNIQVFRYPRGSEQHDYTQYFERRRQEDESIIESIVNSSVRIEGWPLS
jgi:hypothetical protein